MRLSFPRFVCLMVGVSFVFYFLAWKECGTLWIVKKEFYEGARYDLEKERLRISKREFPYISYELATLEMVVGLGVSRQGFLEIPSLPEVKKIPFVAYRIEGGYGRGTNFSITVDKLGKLFTMGANSYLKAGASRGGRLYLEVESKLFSKREESLLTFTSYIVKPGDTLWDISKKFNVTIDTIVSANELQSFDFLKLGQVLKIPNVSGVFHKVSKGETLEKIAKLYGVNLEDIKKYNRDKSMDPLQAGTLVFVPGGRLQKRKEPSQPRWLASRGTSQRFIWPLRGEITSRFGWRSDPFSRGREFHSGLDISASRGSPIVASRGGKVVYAGWMSGYGLLVVIDHGDGWETWYGHCSRINVREGQYVDQGEIIGRVGSTGRTTGSHLHFEIRKDGRPLNPLYYLR